MDLLGIFVLTFIALLLYWELMPLMTQCNVWGHDPVWYPPLFHGPVLLSEAFAQCRRCKKVMW
jgi:hypothetical protein